MATYSEKLKDPRWQKKRLEVFQRDGFRCQLCDDDKTTLAVHHKKYASGKNPWDYDNNLLITLCENCHDKIHPEKRKAVVDTSSPSLYVDLTKELIREKEIKEKSIAPIQTYPTAPLGALSKIRAQVLARNAVKSSHMKLTPATLQKQWDWLTLELELSQNPSFRSFNNAILGFCSDDEFEILVESSLDERFIEQQKEHIYHSFSDVFFNKNIRFSIWFSKEIPTKVQYK